MATLLPMVTSLFLIPTYSVDGLGHLEGFYPKGVKVAFGLDAGQGEHFSHISLDPDLPREESLHGHLGVIAEKHLVTDIVRKGQQRIRVIVVSLCKPALGEMYLLVAFRTPCNSKVKDETHQLFREIYFSKGVGDLLCFI